MKEVFGNVVIDNKNNNQDSNGKQICKYFIVGLCDKGKKCKYSHENVTKQDENDVKYNESEQD